MRGVIAASVATLGLIAMVSGAQAAPAALHDPFVGSRPAVIEVRGGCGPGMHPVRYVNRWGNWRVRCVPNRW
jgi:hypothetical protein